MKKVRVAVTVRGITALLIHRFAEQSEQNAGARRVTVSVSDPRIEAEKSAYKRPDGTYYISAFAIIGCMRGAGGGHKMKGSRKSLRFVVPSAIMVDTDAITILDLDGKPSKGFEVDSRPVTIPATKGRIMRHRPRWNSWKLAFSLEIDTDMLSPDDAQMLLTEGGSAYGVGDFRPEKCGPFGRFMVESWKIV